MREETTTVSEKIEMSREGLRVLRTEGEITLKNWNATSDGSVDLNRQSDLRQAVREASAKLEEVDAIRRERDKE